MGFRTLILTKESKLSIRMNNLIVKGENPIPEIDVLLIENPNITLTGHLINALSDRKIVTIVCDKKHMPFSTITPIYGHHRRAKLIKVQVDWKNEYKERLWQLIIKEKIAHQKQVLEYFNPGVQFKNMEEYSLDVHLNDSTNREGHAAKVYFNRLFDDGFTRNQDCARNAALNYGYMIIHSIFTRTIIHKGYLTELGIKHINEFNQYNLASDFMEVFRPLVDFHVRKFIFEEFEKEHKRIILNLINQKININGKQQYLLNAIDIYVDSLIKYLNEGDESLAIFPNWKYG